MTPKVESENDSVRVEIANLKGEIKATCSSVTDLRAQERQSARYQNNLLTLLVVGVGLLSAVFTAWNTVRVDNILESAERRISALVGALNPQRAWMHGLKSDSDKTIQIYLTIEAANSAGLEYFVLSGAGSVIARINGPSGKIIGHLSKITGSGADIMMRNLGGTPNYAKLQLQTKGLFAPEKRDEGILVSEEAHLNVTYSTVRRFVTCEEAEKVVASLTKLGANDTTLEIKPVFSNISKPPNFHEFQVTYRRGSYPSCSIWATRKSNAP